MNNILQKTLISRYNIFFEYLKEYDGDLILPIHFGIECGDGWFTLLDTLMGRIKSYCKYQKVEPINIQQVKEKLGTLRFYYTGGDEYIGGIVSMAEHMSSNICEECGTTLDVGRTNGWISYSCEYCHKNNRRRKDLEWIPNKDNRLIKLAKIMKNIN
jgi:hypothetical protein